MQKLLVKIGIFILFGQKFFFSIFSNCDEKKKYDAKNKKKTFIARTNLIYSLVSWSDLTELPEPHKTKEGISNSARLYTTLSLFVIILPEPSNAFKIPQSIR